jgi:hypothetical protein
MFGLRPAMRGMPKSRLPGVVDYWPVTEVLIVVGINDPSAESRDKGFQRPLPRALSPWAPLLRAGAGEK